MLSILIDDFLALSLGIGETGVYYSIVVAESAMTIAAVWYFKRGKWKLKVV